MYIFILEYKKENGEKKGGKGQILFLFFKVFSFVYFFCFEIVCKFLTESALSPLLFTQLINIIIIYKFYLFIYRNLNK